MIASLLPVIVSVLSAGGLIGAVIALVKLRPESGQIVVTAAQGALIVQTGVIESLKQQNERQQARIAAQEAQIERCTTRIAALEEALRSLRDELRNGRGQKDHG